MERDLPDNLEEMLSASTSEPQVGDKPDKKETLGDAEYNAYAILMGRWDIKGKYYRPEKEYGDWVFGRPQMFNNDMAAIVQEFSSPTKAQTPHPIYRIMRYATPVTWNGIVYPNIEYALSDYRRELETGFASDSGFANAEEELSEENKQYAYSSSMHTHIPDKLDRYACDTLYIVEDDGDLDMTFKVPPPAELIQIMVYQNKLPGKDVLNKLNSRFANLMNQVFFQYDLFHKAIMTVKGKVLLRSYDMSEVVHFKRLEIVRDSITAK